MKKLSLAVVFANILITQNFAFADEIIEVGYVVSTEPVIERLYAPSRSCRHPTYRTYGAAQPVASDEEVGQAIIGALLGAAAGSAFGKGTGKDASTALGAIIGSKIATGGGFSGEEILGALIGGAAGNQVGGGSGRTLATAAGALAGSALAKGLVSRNPKEFSHVCGKEVVSRRVITGYLVEYEFNDYIFTTVMPYEPDDTVELSVHVDVIEDLTIYRRDR